MRPTRNECIAELIVIGEAIVDRLRARSPESRDLEGVCRRIREMREVAANSNSVTLERRS